MNLKEYFADDDNLESAKRLEELVGVCATMPINHCLVCCFKDEEMLVLEPAQDVKISFDKCNMVAIERAAYGDPAYIVIRANGELFLKNVGAPYGAWARAYKVLGRNVFVLECQD